MKLFRRTFLHLAAGAAAVPAVSRFAWAQAYPTRPVRVVVGFPPGGVSDLYARLISQWLSVRVGQPFIVENRAGAGGSVATESVTRAAPDGYTLLLTASNDSVNPSLYNNLNFNFVRDMAAVAGIARGMAVLVVNPSMPTRTVPELISYIKSNPGKFTVASAGVGSNSHVCWELFKSMAGIDMLHVPYRGEGPALSDLLGGQVQVMLPTISPTIQHVSAGTLRPLAVTGAQQTQVFPDVPVLAEFLPGYESSLFVGIAAPRNTPSGIIEKLNGEINAGLADPSIRLRIAELGDVVFPASAAAFGRFIAEETERMGKLMKAAGVKAQ